MTFYQSSFTTVVNQFSALINLLPILTKGLESVSSIGEVLSSDDVECNEGKEELASLKGDYLFKQVSFAYPGGEKEVLSGLELSVRQGETIALVGESGSGKTTILNLLIGFILPSKGELLIDGKDIKGLNLRSYRRFISVVPQTPVLFTGTVRENITYGLEHVSEEQVRQAVEAANFPRGLTP